MRAHVMIGLHYLACRRLLSMHLPSTVRAEGLGPRFAPLQAFECFAECCRCHSTDAQQLGRATSLHASLMLTFYPRSHPLSFQCFGAPLVLSPGPHGPSICWHSLLVLPKTGTLCHTFCTHTRCSQRVKSRFLVHPLTNIGNFLVHNNG